ncbi:hypothetical protein PSTEL_09585 [Paenibacillus stellifer]|uniref:Uncharacterized protein n=1 Tax=Paenibacillus stellifer TaxID=169760 RepID=A0A089LP23_9BACL|nr:hypothetical protein [Paenibacillus stellifer]AIQ63301.1 hypothetical protein PSTEL_09585 [Paenibacillus stellifer]
MELAVKEWVFNPGLKNMVVSVNGLDEEGDKVNIKGLVVEVKGDAMEVRSIYDPQTLSTFYLHEFGEEHGLKLEAWDAGPTAYEVSEEYRNRWDEEDGAAQDAS